MIITISISFLLIISIIDIRHRRIPNAINVIFLLLGFSVNFHLNSLSCSIIGAVVGLSLMLAPYLLGGMGAGDVKAMAALGALIGHPAILQTFLYTALIGGAIAFVYYIFSCDLVGKTRDALIAFKAFAGSHDPRCLVTQASAPSKHKFPYAPAIALGYFAFLLWGDLI